MAYSIVYALDLGPANTGQAANLRAQLYTPSGAASGSAISTGFSEPRSGTGRYLWQPSGYVPDSFRGAVELYLTGTTTGVTFAVNPEEGFNLDATVSSRAAPGTITVVPAAGVTAASPVSPDGTDVTLVAGDDYASSEGRSVAFTDNVSGGSWPNLTGGTVKLSIRNLNTGSGVDITGTIGSPGVPPQSATFQPTATQTAQLKPGEPHRYALIATLSNGHAETLNIGDVTVLGDPV